jgi:hypothetical protein
LVLSDVITILAIPALEQLFSKMRIAGLPKLPLQSGPIHALISKASPWCNGIRLAQ